MLHIERIAHLISEVTTDLKFVADILRGNGLKDLNVSIAFIEPGSTWENG